MRTLARAYVVAGALVVVDDEGAVVFVHPNVVFVVVFGVEGVGAGALGGGHGVFGVDNGGGAQCRFVGFGDAEVEGELRGDGGGFEDANFGGGGGGDGGSDDKLVFGVLYGLVVESALEVEQVGVLLRREELVEGDVDDRLGDGDGRSDGLVCGAPRLGAGAVDGLECVDEALVGARVADEERVVAADLVGEGEELARDDGVDVVEEEDEGGDVLDVDGLVDAEGGGAAAVAARASRGVRCVFCCCIWEQWRLREWRRLRCPK